MLLDSRNGKINYAVTYLSKTLCLSKTFRNPIFPYLNVYSLKRLLKFTDTYIEL